MSDDPIISIGRNLEGQIRINGSLGNSDADYEIDIATGMDEDDAAIVIDYDGWDSGDSWQQGAEIQVGQTDYDGNDPDDHIYEVTRCKADMNNDEWPDFDDIDPFVAAFAGEESFDAAYPGLAGAMVFHADLDCDEEIDFDDVDLFVARLGECCYELCGDCPGDGEGGGQLSALELATELALHIAPERYDTLCDMIAEVAERQENEEEADYWHAVWTYLTGVDQREGESGGA